MRGKVEIFKDTEGEMEADSQIEKWKELGNGVNVWPHN